MSLHVARVALFALLFVPGLALAQGPPRPSPAAPAAPTRCNDLASCDQALRVGSYAVAEAGLTRLSRGRGGAAATIALARVFLETGRYEQAADLARPLARTGADRVAAATLLGEAEMARGRLDEAQRALEAVAGETTAHRGRVMLGRLLLRRGRDAEAQPRLMALIQAYNDETIPPNDAEGLAYVGMAAWMLDSAHDANDAFVESARSDPSRVETQLEWAQLFLQKYDAGHAEESVGQALQHNPNSAVAHALLARIKLAQSLDFVAAEAELQRALAVNPNLVMAHVTRAGIAIRDMDLAAADQHLDRALAIDPNDLEALSVRAAQLFLSGDDRAYRAAVREVLSRNPRFSELYTIIADYADWEHRYPQIVEMAREAIRIDPNDALARATLGLNLLRMGEEQEGLAELRTAFRRDSFNVRVYNMLNLFDDVLDREYETFDAAPFVFRMHREERPIMERTATVTLRRAWEDMRRRYHFTPHTPVHIEMFSDPQHFSVRTSGLPNVGVQGVCFGQVVTALSPRGGPFNWAQITWHEVAHVFHIQMSNNRVPRWFTEGLAEYETIIARPEWHREEDHRLTLALRSGRLPQVAQLNHAFTHARTGEDVTVAYYASSMLVKYIAERFDFDHVVRMLHEWGQGRSDAEVVQRSLGISIDELDRDFREHTRQRLAGRANDFAVDFAANADLDAARARVQAEPSEAAAHAGLAASLLANGQAEEAMQEVRAALRIDRNEPTARFVAAQLAVGARDPHRAFGDLRLLIEGGHDGYEVRLLQARVAFGVRNYTLGREALQRATQIDPERPEGWQGLMQLAERTQQADLRMDALRRLVDIDQHGGDANFELMQALAERNDWDGVRTYGERSIYVDPLRSEARRLYAEALIRTGDPREGLAQADVALLAHPEQPGPAHLTRARALAALRRNREAREAADAAVAADPSLREQAQGIGR